MLPSVQTIREITEKAELANASRYKRQKAERAARKIQEQNKLHVEIMDQLHKLVIGAAERGERSVTYVRDRDQVEFETMRSVAASLTGQGYEASVEPTTTDHGDSAAPAKVAEWTLEISW